MFNIVLYQPEIPPNTGNIIRLCANTGCSLHLIHPLGFSLDEKSVHRAGMDYRELANICQHRDLHAFHEAVKPGTVYAVSTRGERRYSDVQYNEHDTFLFGPETRGLPQNMLAEFDRDHILTIPMLSSSRSLNLANAVSVIVYEAWRQTDFNRLTDSYRTP